MSDTAQRGRPRANPLFLRDEDLRQAIELLFFAYRDFTGEADAILAAYGFGRAHHRAIYFVGANPGISVGELLAILREGGNRLEIGLLLCSRGRLENRAGEMAAAHATLVEAESIAAELAAGPDSPVGKAVAKLREELGVEDGGGSEAGP